MIIVIILGIMAIFLAWLEDSGLCKHGLKLSFGLIFLFLALRYNFGNDYNAYLNEFIEIKNYVDIDFFDPSLHMEIGWNFLCWLCRPIGFFGMVAILALLNCWVYYNFLKKYVPAQYYWFATFIYIFNPGFMLTHASAMRQSIAIALFVFSLDYLFKKDAIRYFLCIGLASLFHTSALILLPLYLLGFLNWRINKGVGVIILSIWVLFFMFGTYLRPYLNQFISDYFVRYECYQEAGIIGTGLGVLYSAILFTLILYYERIQSKEIALIFKIAIIGFLFIPLSLLIQLIGRVGMYFTPTAIIVYPVLLINLKKSVYETVFLVLLFLMTIYIFFQFFYSETYSDAFGTYQTIFSSNQVY